MTGAGRTADEAMSLGEMYGEVRAYKVLRHQHVPEIETALGAGGAGAGRPAADRADDAPVAGRARDLRDGDRAAARGDLDRGAGRALPRRVRATIRSVTIAASAEHVSLRRVVGTNTCAIGVASEGIAGGFVVITAALDNLLKGAAGQAIENMNLMLGLERIDRARSPREARVKLPRGFRFAASRRGSGRASPTSRCSCRIATRRAPACSRSTARRRRRWSTPSAGCRREAMRAIVVTSGNANALTGPAGLEAVDAIASRRRRARSGSIARRW